MSASFRSKRVALIGDSHMAVLGQELASRLRAAGATVTTITSRPGYSTTRLTAELPALLRGADVVVLGAGGNDRPRDAQSYARDLEAAVRIMGDRQVIWLGPATAIVSPYAEYHDRAADMQASLLPQMGVTFVDSRPFTRRGHRDDGVHFTRAGYAGWAENALDQMIVPTRRRRLPLALGLVGAALLIAGTAAVLTRKRRAAA